jgi:hypothetical protein
VRVTHRLYTFIGQNKAAQFRSRGKKERVRNEEDLLSQGEGDFPDFDETTFPSA